MDFQDQVNRMCVVNNLEPQSVSIGETPLEKAQGLGGVRCRYCGGSFESLAAVRGHQKKGCVKRDAAISN